MRMIVLENMVLKMRTRDRSWTLRGNLPCSGIGVVGLSRHRRRIGRRALGLNFRGIIMMYKLIYYYLFLCLLLYSNVYTFGPIRSE